MINKKNIVAKTHYGIQIYSYILRQFYQDTIVLRLCGNACQPTKNPFTKGEALSLHINIENNQAVFYDDVHPHCKGTVFDFAHMYFQTDTEEELLVKINDNLQLKLGEDIDSFQWKQQRISKSLAKFPSQEWNPKFSYFEKNLYNLYPTKTVGILDTYAMLTDTKRAEKTAALRNLTSQKAQKQYKMKHFDYVTFSGIFFKRTNISLIQHSELLTIDIDGITHPSRLQEIKEALQKDAYLSTELLFTSPRGNGLKWIISISLDEVSHAAYFEAVGNYLNQTYQIHIDHNGADISRACLLPYDPEAYVHPKYQL